MSGKDALAQEFEKGKGKRFYSKNYEEGTTEYDSTYNFFHR